MDDNLIKAIADRQAITDILHRYCHGVDRCDMELLKSAYWPDAVDEHGTFNGNALEFCEATLPALKTMTCTMHMVSNILITLDGDKATVQSYCLAYHQIPASAETCASEMIVGGRYLDRMERRGSEWRIAHRLYVMDWNSNAPSTMILDKGLFARLKTRGARFPDDPSDGYGFGSAKLAERL